MDMKTLYLIGGTMGVGKTTVCRERERSTARLPMYETLNTVKIDTTGKTVQETARCIAGL